MARPRKDRWDELRAERERTEGVRQEAEATRRKGEAARLVAMQRAKPPEWDCSADVQKRGSHAGVHIRRKNDSLAGAVAAIASAAESAARTDPDDIGLIVQGSISRKEGGTTATVSWRADYGAGLDPDGAAAFLRELAEMAERAFVPPTAEAARSEPEPEWAGQRYVMRGTREELRGLRNTDAALPHKVGQLISHRGREYRIAALEEDGDLVLVEALDGRNAPGGAGEEQATEEQSEGSFRSRYPRTLRYKKGERKGPKPPWEESKPG
jgi:hypothetical protein